METDLQTLITDFADFKKYILEVFVSLIETNQCYDLGNTKYLHSKISDLQIVIKSKDQIINLLRNDMKTLQDQLNVNESNTWKFVNRISHKSYIPKTQAENSNFGIITFNRLDPLSPDIRTTNKDDTSGNDFQNVINNSITNNTNNASETERSKKSRKVSHYATTPYFVNRQQQQQQQQQNCLFLTTILEMVCVTRKVSLEIYPIVALHNQVQRPIFLALVWSVILKQKKLNNKLRGAFARI